MNIKVLYIFLTLTLLTTVSCISEFNANLPSNDVQILFVDGTITANSDMTFYLSKSFSINDINIPPESLNTNAKIFIIGSNGYQSPPAINLGRGTYIIPSIGELDDNVEYGIRIEYEGDAYQSTLSKPLHTPEIDSVSWTQPEKAGEVFFRVSTHDDTGQAHFFIWNYTEDWEITASYYTTAFYNSITNEHYTINPAPHYYCWKNRLSNTFLIGSTESLGENRIINKQLYHHRHDDDRFSLLYSVVVYQKAITKNAFEYYHNKIVINDEMGGLFTPQPSELTGNITCITNPSKKVMGYIEPVKNITQKRIFVQAENILGPRPFNCKIMTSSDVATYLANNEIDYNQFIASGFRPALELDIMTGMPLEWSTASCTDCVLNGGSKKKPDFWPNDHE